ncbi:MAG TPA: histidinol-phosphate transaminase [Dissulfurispiraceae bacterium]
MKRVAFQKLVRENVRSLRPYQAEEIPCRVKLDANESPYRVPAGLLAKKVAGVHLNRYPDPDARKLKKAVSRELGVEPCNILAGNGSDELIYYLIIAFGGPVLFPVPTFSMYGIISQALGARHIGVPLDGDFDIDIKSMLAAIRKHRPKLVFLSSPNNPTGNCFSPERIRKVIEASKGIVVVDEAYQPFSRGRGFLPQLERHKNLAVLRTLSKIGLASLRVGLLIGDGDLVREVNKVRLPFNLNSLSQAAALEALRDRKAIRSHINAIAAERERVFGELNGMEGVEPYPSDANFILFKVDDAHNVFLRLLKSGVLIRDLSGAIGGALRVTIGTPEENDAFIRALKKAAGRKR